MSAFLALFRRELAAYFRTPLALVFTVIFLMLSNSFVFYLGDLYETGQASMQAYFRLLPWVCLLLVPAMSMRSWSEEFRSGTIELLDALPLPPWQQVLAKFVALWCVAVSALLLSFPLWLSLAWLGDPDHGTIMLGYIGICLMLAAMLAIGLCVSSFSENQLVVYLLTAMILLLYLLAGYPLALNPVREIFPQYVVDLIGSMSFLTHLNAITRGVLDLRDVLFFAVTVLFWLAVNLLVLRARKGGA
jgi:ABC-2 type transport system permease protein